MQTALEGFVRHCHTPLPQRNWRQGDGKLHPCRNAEGASDCGAVRVERIVRVLPARLCKQHFCVSCPYLQHDQRADLSARVAHCLQERNATLLG